MLDSPIALTGDTAKDVTTSPVNSVRLFLPDVSQLETLPLNGRITFDYRRESLQLRGADKLSAELMLTALVDVEEKEAEDADDSVDRLYASMADKPENEA